jgi:hypothetical protein
MEGFQLELRADKEFYIQTALWDRGFTPEDLGDAIMPNLKHDAYVVWEDSDTGQIQVAPLKKGD